MDELKLPVDEQLLSHVSKNVVLFNQLAVKIDMANVTKEQYYAWLERASRQIGQVVTGAQIAEKPGARTNPTLNTAVYYDTKDYRILPTGALLRTSCNKITHAFCAYKAAQDDFSVRRDYRYVFSGEEKETIQKAPASTAAVNIVRNLLSRGDSDTSGHFLERDLGINPSYS